MMKREGRWAGYGEQGRKTEWVGVRVEKRNEGDEDKR